MKTDNSLNALDLFCGAGGFSNGLEAAGFKCLLGIDFDKAAMQTFEANHKYAKAICGDLRQITTKQIKEVLGDRKIHLVCGGPPCQGFSTVGANNADDQRNHLFLEFVRVVRDLKPDYLILENVTGILSKRNGNTLVSIIKCFTELGYHLDIRVLSAHHYGVAEKRRRTIMIGNKLGVDNIYPSIMFDDEHAKNPNIPKSNTVKWAFDNFIYSNGVAYNHNISDAQIKSELEKRRLHHVPSGKSIRYEEDELKYLPEDLKFGVDWQQIYEGRFRQAKLHRLDLNDCSPTVNTSKTTYYHPVEDRYLTPREAAAIQSFPSDFIFHGTVTQQWRQIGNAVPPLLGKALGLAIIEMEKNKHIKPNFPRKLTVIENVRKKAFNYRPKSNTDDSTAQLTLSY